MKKVFPKGFVTPLVNGVLFCLIFMGVNIQAKTLTADFSSSTSTTAYGLSFDGEFAKPEEDSSVEYGYSGNINVSNSKTTDSTTGNDITDKTTSLSLGANASTQDLWSFGAGLNLSATPAEYLTSAGLDINGGKGYKYETWKWSWGLDFGATRYAQVISAANAPRKSGGGPRNREMVNDITQFFSKVILKIKPVKWFQSKTDYTDYGYDKDLRVFIGFLDNPKFGNSTSGISNTAMSFPRYTIKETLYFYIGEEWTLKLPNSYSYGAYDGEITLTNELDLNHSFNDFFSVEIGDSTSKGNGDRTNTVLVSLDYNF